MSFLSLGLQPDFARIVLSLAAVGHVVALVGALVLVLRRSGLAKFSPACAVIGLQILWFSIPFSLTHWGLRTGIDPLDNGINRHYGVFTGMGHAAQYLWGTPYYARASATWTGYPRYLAKMLLSGAAIWPFPGLVFAGSHLGTRESAEDSLLLIAAAANLHHFILDGAIWKLRNSRVANLLIRSVPNEVRGDDTASALPWLRPTV